MVESAMDAAPFMVGDFMSMAPPLILSASCECVGDAPLSATPPSISVSDILVDFAGLLQVVLVVHFADYFLERQDFMH
jgi:hypothetical protein